MFSLASNTKDDESGFTLIELLVVILIIGILSAIAIPAFLNQRKEATAAAVKSDLKNAATIMETEVIKNGSKYPSYLPNYKPSSQDIGIVIDKANSSPTKYCLQGFSESNPDITYYYDSLAGGLLNEGVTCTPVTGDNSYAAALQEKKILIVHVGGSVGTHNEAIKRLETYGFGTVDYKEDAPESEFKNYDILASFGTWAQTPGPIEAKLYSAFQSGQSILTDGNDTGQPSRNWMFSSSTVHGREESTPLYFNKTGKTGLTPAFPYTFTATTFNGDQGWRCNVATPNVVVLADSPMSNNPDRICATAVGANSPAGGQWIHASRFSFNETNQHDMLDAGINWLLM